MQILLPLEHRGNTHVTFAESVLDGTDCGVSVVVEHGAWLLMGGPVELAVQIRPDPPKEVAVP